jgi:hypothetical protein
MKAQEFFRLLANQTSRKYIGLILCFVVAVIWKGAIPPYVFDFMLYAYLAFVGGNVVQDIVKNLKKPEG